MDRVLRHAIEQGLDPMTAIQMMTINTAEHFGLSREMGMIAPGRWADMVLVKDLKQFQGGSGHRQRTGDRGEWQVESGTAEVHLSGLGDEFGQFETKPLKAEDFKLVVKGRIRQGQSECDWRHRESGAHPTSDV